MKEHLSSLVLDEVAAGLPVPPEATAHLAFCDACRARLDDVKRAREAAAASPASTPVLERLLARAEAPVAPPKPKLRWLHVAAVALPLAAGLALLVVNPIRQPVDDARLKGAPSVELLNEAGAPVTRAKPGETLTLAVGGGGFTHVVVLGLDAQGVSTLWPKDGATLGAVAPGARVRLDTFTVTPGDVRVVALFASTPRRLGELTTPLMKQAVLAVRERQSPLDLPVPAGLAEGVASVTLEVAP